MFCPEKVVGLQRLDIWLSNHENFGQRWLTCIKVRQIIRSTQKSKWSRVNNLLHKNRKSVSNLFHSVIHTSSSVLHRELDHSYLDQFSLPTLSLEHVHHTSPVQADLLH